MKGVPHQPPPGKDFEKNMEMTGFRSRICTLLQSCWTSRLSLVQKVVSNFETSILVVSNQRLQNPKIVKVEYALE